MGFPMARNLLAAGLPLAVHNRTRAKAEPLAAGGAAVAASAAEAAERARIVITMLADDQAIETLAEAFSSRRPGWTASRCSRRSTARSSLRRSTRRTATDEPGRLQPARVPARARSS